MRSGYLDGVAELSQGKEPCSPKSSPRDDDRTLSGLPCCAELSCHLVLPD